MSKISYEIEGYLHMTPEVGILTFGKHKGAPLYDVPIDYLRWCLREMIGTVEFRRIVRDELHERVHRGVGTFDFEEMTPSTTT
jgi:hypothetical protein